MDRRGAAPYLRPMSALPSRLTFVTCLLAAPVIFAAVTGLFDLGGEYLKRFAFVGRAGLLLSLPAWLTAFAWLAWRTAKRGETGIRPYVFASLGANAASLAIYPLMIFITEALGGGLAEQWRDAVVAMSEGGDMADAISFSTATLLSGCIVFFIGLFFMPMLGALFGWVAGLLGLVKSSPPTPGKRVG